jgi:hypothetical protein
LSAGAEIRIPRDTYNLNKEPVAFYFDFSGSCEDYSGMFAQMTAGLIQKGATTYIGMNGDVTYRIDRAPANCTARDLMRLLHGRRDDRFGIKYYTGSRPMIEKIVKEENVKKIVIYTDYDADINCVRTSEVCETIWFCAQNRGELTCDKKLDDFKGKFYRAQTISQIKTILSRLDDANFERENRNTQLGRR